MAIGRIHTMLLKSEQGTLWQEVPDKSPDSVLTYQDIKNNNASLGKLQRLTTLSMVECQGLSFLLCHTYVLNGVKEN